MRKSQILLLVMLTAVTAGLSACSHVSEDWKAAQAANTAEAYQDFLRQHPDSEFGVTAQERIKQLAEDRDWQAASKADTLDAYQQFVATHADGKWAQEARVRIENFQLSANGQTPPAAAEAAVGTAGAAAGATVPATAPEAPAAKPGTTAAASPTAKPGATVKAAGGAAAKKPAIIAKSGSRAAARKPVTHKSGHRQLAQLGAYGSRARAEAAWRKLSGKYPSQLKALRPRYVAGTYHGKAIVRLQVRVSSSKQSRELCSALRKQAQPCVPVD